MNRILLISAISLLPFMLHAQIAVKGEIIHTMAGDPIADGVVLIRDGRIEKVGSADRIDIPSVYKVFTAKVVTPGFIDAHSVVGLAGYLNQPDDQDQLEAAVAIQPELRAIDAYNARERLVAWLREFGVTTVHTGHGPGALISGQTMIVKTVGETVDQALIKPRAMLAMTLGPSAEHSSGKNPGTRSKMMAMLRADFLKAQAYMKKMEGEKKPDRDLKLEVLADALKGELPVLVTANQAQDIMSAIRLAREFKLKLFLDGAAEAYLLIDQIKASGAGVILHPTMQRSYGERQNLSMETAAVLTEAGIPVSLQSGYEAYVPKTRVVLFEAAVAAANGLSWDQALATITINPARALGIADRVGSLEKGKDADLVLFDGDPFEYTSHVTSVLVNGEVVSTEQR